MKISILVPVLNEEKTIKETLTKVLKQREVGEVIVVDDGSTDSTPSILEKVKKVDRRIRIITHKKNLGKGAAVQSALLKASFGFCLIQDADLEYNPDEYKILLKKASNNSAVYGSRILSRNPHAYERTYFGNIFITAFCNLLFGTKLTDTYTCYKLIPTKIMRSLSLSSNGFEIEAEITGKLAKKKITIVEVPISFSPRKYEEGKKIKAKDALKGAVVFLKIRLFY